MSTDKPEPGSLLKPEPIECPCGCKLVGQPRKKIWVGETVGHVRGCKCRRCVGGRQRGKSRRRENRIAKDLGGQREPLSGGLSGIDVRVGETVWIEDTKAENVARGIRRWWTSKTVTSKMERISKRGKQMGVPVALVVAWGDERARPRVAVLDYESFTNLVKMADECRENQ